MADQRRAVQEAVQAGVAEGRNGRNIALDLVGRISPATGRRDGGIIGLTSGQARAVTRARAELEALDAGYFDRTARDRRFDASVRRAMRDGKPLTAEEIQRITARYSDRLLKVRGDMIARTEALSALHAGQYEAMQQLIDSGKVRADQVTKVWSATGDGRTRDTHQALNETSVGFSQPFVTESGAMLLYPQDTSLGAGPEEIVACRCHMFIRVKHL